MTLQLCANTGWNKQQPYPRTAKGIKGKKALPFRGDSAIFLGFAAKRVSPLLLPGDSRTQGRELIIDGSGFAALCRD